MKLASITHFFKVERLLVQVLHMYNPCSDASNLVSDIIYEINISHYKSRSSTHDIVPWQRCALKVTIIQD